MEEAVIAGVNRLLGNVISQLAEREQGTASVPRGESWEWALSIVARLHGTGQRVWRLGHIPFVGAEFFDRLISESRTQPRSVLPTFQRADPGPVLRSLAVDRRLHDLVAETVGFRVTPDHTPFYQFYEEPGACVPPHLDSNEVSVAMALEHVPPIDGSDGSGNVLYQAGQAPLSTVLKPGEALIFQGGRALHAREPTKSGERVTILLIGFDRLNPLG